MNGLKAVIEALLEHGLLLQQDKVLLNVVSIVTGESPKKSWWCHPLAGKVFGVIEHLSMNPDVITTKMVGGKVTFVHRQLWPSLLALGRSMEDWQFDGLSQEALELYRKIETEGFVCATSIGTKELEQKLLIRSWQEHVESGEHRTMLEAWARWAKRERIKPVTSVIKAKTIIEQAVEEIGGKRALLPWNKANLKRK